MEIYFLTLLEIKNQMLIVLARLFFSETSLLPLGLHVVFQIPLEESQLYWTRAHPYDLALLKLPF